MTDKTLAELLRDLTPDDREYVDGLMHGQPDLAPAIARALANTVPGADRDIVPVRARPVVEATDERRYTLAEAQQHLARQECFGHGHDFDVIVTVGSGTPQSVICSRCGESWAIKPKSDEEKRGS